MNCSEAHTLIRPFLKGKTSIRETSAFLRHIEGCRDCMDELEVNFMITAAVSPFDREDIDYDLSSGLRNYLKKRKKEVNRLLFGLILALTALAAGLTVLIVTIIKTGVPFS